MITQGESPRPKVALLPWGDRIEDFLDTIQVPFETFRDEVSGGWLFGYVDALRSVGVETVLVCVSARVTRPAREQHKPTGATIWLLPAPRLHRVVRKRIRKPGPKRAVRTLLRDVSSYLATPPRLLAAVLEREGCSAIVVQEYEYPRFDVCVAMGRIVGLPVFGVFQGGDFQLSRLERHLRPHTLKACAGLIIGPGREAQRVAECYGIPTERIARILNPIDVEEWRSVGRSEARQTLGIPEAATVVVWHGRVDLHPKGLDVLTEAWRTLCRDRQGRDLRLLLVGTGSDAERLRQLLTGPGLPGICWVDEYIRDRGAMRRYLSAGDVSVVASRHEGLPVAPIEAMACGLPIVASDASGIRDILAGGERSGGLVVPVANPAALASALGRLVDDRALCRALGARARLRVEECFSLRAAGEQMLAFLSRRGVQWPRDPA